MGRSMVQKAIRIGNRLGINLTEGVLVEASGNCLLESVKGNIEDREIFENKIEETITQLRLKSASEGERVIGASPYRIEDYSDEDWSSNWDLLKECGVWNVDYFGDLMIIALAHYIGKNILLINTDPGSPPVTVVLGDRFGNPLNSEYPVILAYNGTHYESLIPLTDHDERMSRIIIQKYIKDEDLFDDNNNEASSVNTIQSKQILIQRSEPIIKHKEDDAILNEKNDARIGVDRWSRYHPTNTNSKNAINSSGHYSSNITWAGETNSISIPIQIVK